MNLLSLATRHVRDELPAIAPELAHRIDPASFVVEQRYLTRRVVFLGRDGEPVVVYKVATEPRLNHFLETGLDALTRAARSGGTVATPLARTRFGERLVLVTEWLPGCTLAQELARGPQGMEALADAVAVVTRLHMATLNRAESRIPALEARAAWWLEVLSADSVAPRSVRALAADCIQATLHLTGCGPSVAMHGDFVTVNLVRGPAGGLSPIDWDLGLAEGPPAVDLITLLLDSAGTRTGRTRAQSLRACFLDRTREAEGCWQTLATYASALELDRGTLSLLVGATHVKMVAEDRHYARLHLGQITGERACEELLVLEELFDRFPELMAATRSPKGASS